MNDKQIDRLSETLSDFGLVLFTSTVIPAFVEGTKVPTLKALLAFLGGLSSIILSLLILKGADK